MSKGQIALEKICNRFPLNSTSDLIIPVEKELKALEIIKNKFVNVMILQRADSIDIYNKYNTKQITEEEYEILKEVLL